ncbi:Methyltransferase type 12 domain protein [Gracilaria domingensis]|nr:Methyltransferase type 12 domain protein [Gracilaria domingensis]
MPSLNFAPPLSEDEYARLYDIRRNASTMTSTSVVWLCSQSQEFLKSCQTASTKSAFNVLSVGPGNGDIDIPFLRTLEHKISRDADMKLNSIRYVALEPNHTYRETLLQRMRHSALNLVTFEIHRKRFEDFDDEMATYDIVLFSHVMYYFEHCALALKRARNLACRTGSVIIFHASCTGVPGIIKKVAEFSKDEKLYILLANDIKHVLERLAAPFRYLELPAELDLSECMQPTERGRDIMSFCLERDLRGLDNAKLHHVSKMFCEEATETKNGTIVLKEPVAVFSVTPM